VISTTIVDADGLAGSAPAYRYSTNGGTNWTGWIADASLVYVPLSATQVAMTATIASLVESATANQVQFQIVDQTLNMETSPAYTIRVDATAPAAPTGVSATPSSWTNSDSFTVNWTNPADASGIVRVYYKLGSAPTGPGDISGWYDAAGVNSLSGISVGTHGAHTLYLWLQDAAGNSNYLNRAQVTLWLDVQAPTSPIALSVTPSTWTATNAFTLSWTNPAQSDAPINRAYYKFNSAPTSASDYSGFSTGTNIWRIDSLAVPGSGAIPCYVWLGDAAGNANHTAATSVTLYYSGGGAPEPPFALQMTPSTWTATNVFTATWTNPSSTAGIVAAWYKWNTPPSTSSDGTRVAGANITSLSGLSAPQQGTNTLYVWLEDSTGTKDHTKRSDTVARYDTEPPVTTPSYNPTLPASGWYKTAVTVNLVATDAHAGIKETRWRRSGGLWNLGTSFVATDDSTYEYHSTDNANNAEAIKTLSVPIDTQPPMSSLVISPPEPAGGWYSQTVTVNITATDDRSGWEGDSWYRLNGGALQAGNHLTLSISGVYALQYYSVDRAGNQEELRTQSPLCRIDTIAPSVTATPDKVGDFLKPPVNVTLAATDAHSGVARVEYRRLGQSAWISGTQILVDGSQGDGVYTYEYRARDVANNIAAPQTISLSIDDTPPGLPTSLVALPTGWTNQNGLFGLTWANPTDYSGIAGVFYQLDVNPTQSVQASYVEGANIQALPNLTLLTEGQHTIYIWLKDGAGNSSVFSSVSVPNAFKYDATSPSIDASPSGPLGDDPLYFKGPVQVSLSAQDGLSGIAALLYRIEDGSWTTVPIAAGPPSAQHAFTFSQQGRHTVQYRAQDVAGNLSPIQSTYIRLDSEAPTSPAGLVATPSGWTKVNSFQLCWNAPDDYSGVGTAYYKVGSAPVSASDYDRAEPLLVGQNCISGIALDQQGDIPIYVWLKDRAGNVNHATAVPVSLKYDVTAPTSSLSLLGTEGKNGYHTTPVTLRLAATDGISGIDQVLYRINGGDVRTWDGQDVVINQEGEYQVEYWSVDRAGNEERPHRTALFKIDLFAPSSALSLQTDYVTGSTVLVSWRAQDTQTGSGVARYTVQYRQGGCAPWQNWLSSTTNVSQIFSGMQANNFYSFRVRAEDNAGLLSQWSLDGPATRVYAEGLGNSDFELQRLGAWVAAGRMATSVVYAPAYDGSNSYMARIGQELACDVDAIRDAYGSLSQSIQLPTVACDEGLLLTFRYRIRTWDTAWGKDSQDQNKIKPFDPFVVHIRDINGNELMNMWPAGNRVDWTSWAKCEENYLYDSGWRVETIDLTPWAGRRIWIDFRQWNLVDNNYPSWTFVDDVHLVPTSGRLVRLPLIYRPHGGSASQGAVLQDQPLERERRVLEPGARPPRN
jgi:hypothetical protein